jgi:NADH-quinone oxidoreductase subunit D
VILGELTRLQNHASSIGFLIQEMGASGTPLMYAFREREKILDLFEALTGARMMCNYMRFGGCRVDANAGLAGCDAQGGGRAAGFVDEFERAADGQRDSDGAHAGRGHSAAGAGGECRRHRADAARVGRELRHSQGGSLRHLRPLQVPRAAGRSRRRLRPLHDPLLEMRESIKILEQALKDIPAGPVMDPKAKIRGFRPKPGEAYGRIEAPKGELGFYLISDGGPNPYRYRCGRRA